MIETETATQTDRDFETILDVGSSNGQMVLHDINYLVSWIFSKPWGIETPEKQ